MGKKILGFIDEFLLWLTFPIVQAWSALTGKSSLVLARYFVISTFPVAVVGLFLAALQNYILAPIYDVAAILILDATYLRIRTIRFLEKIQQLDKERETISLDSVSLTSTLCEGRFQYLFGGLLYILSTLTPLIDFRFGLIMGSVYFLWALSCYSIMHDVPPGGGIRQLLGNVKQKLARILAPAPHPQPQPT